MAVIESYRLTDCGPQLQKDARWIIQRMGKTVRNGGSLTVSDDGKTITGLDEACAAFILKVQEESRGTKHEAECPCCTAVKREAKAEIP